MFTVFQGHRNYYLTYRKESNLFLEAREVYFVVISISLVKWQATTQEVKVLGCKAKRPGQGIQKVDVTFTIKNIHAASNYTHVQISHPEKLILSFLKIFKEHIKTYVLSLRCQIIWEQVAASLKCLKVSYLPHVHIIPNLRSFLLITNKWPKLFPF